MSDKGTVAPKERINIKYVPATGDKKAEIELPLKTMVIGDFKGKAESTPLEERVAIAVGKNNFNAVMKESELQVTTVVPNKLVDDAQDLSIALSFASLEDFSPDSIAKQVPELQKLIGLRDALTALKGPLGNLPHFRTHIQQLLSDEGSREKLLSELQFIISQDGTE